MMRRISLWAAICVTVAVGVGHAQMDGGEPLADQLTTEALPFALAQEPSVDQPASQTARTAPLSAVLGPTLGVGEETRSFLLPSFHLIQSLGGGTGSQANFHGVTRLLGSLELQRVRKRSQTNLEYVGGFARYSSEQRGLPELHELQADQVFFWKKGQLAVRDAFSYLPEGSFGHGSYGGVGGLGLGGFTGSGGLGGIFFGSEQFGSVGQDPRINNVAVVDLTQALTARSAATLAVGYASAHFLENTQGLINSQQFSVQAGYSYMLNRSNELALIYGHQSFRYPVSFAGDFRTNLVQLLFAHRISGRMELVAGAGPQVTITDNPLLGEERRLGVSARAALRYQFPKTGVDFTYHRYTTSGSGFFLGSNSDVIRLAVNRPLSRLWGATLDAGYAHNSRLQLSLFGSDALSYHFVHAGGGVHRQMGRYWRASFHYQFTDVDFNNSLCLTATANCGRTALRHSATIGLDWHPRPIRLD